jgi:hypothetical protein
MKKSTKLYLDVGTVTLNTSAILFCSMTHYWLLVIFSTILLLYGINEVICAGIDLDSKEE